MTPNTIELFPDGRIGCYEMPEKPEPPIFWEKQEWYNKALEAAKRDAVYFKDQKETIELLETYLIFERGKSSHPIPILLKDCISKPYPIPDGYEVKIEDWYKVKEDTKWIYKGLTLKFKSVYMETYHLTPEYGRSLRLSLEGTPFENRYSSKVTVIHECDLILSKYAILEPKEVERGAGDDYPIIPVALKYPKDWPHSNEVVKPVYHEQQSIEEAAEKSCSYDWKITREAYEEGFITGAKWQAAKTPTDAEILKKAEEFIGTYYLPEKRKGLL